MTSHLATISRFGQSAFEQLEPDEWDDNEAIRNAAEGEVTPNTSALFQLVVEDNGLAFLDFDAEADSPFAALQAAIAEAVEQEVRDLIDAAREDDGYVEDDKGPAVPADADPAYQSEA